MDQRDESGPGAGDLLGVRNIGYVKIAVTSHEMPMTLRNAVVMSQACTARPSWGRYPWLASVLSMGQGPRTSDAVGGTKVPFGDVESVC